uniref:Uncharacterized protein n=1 Tax=Chenopodium quinoa TaxID=63459 RepID=A0A803NF00_CHEQI
MTIYLALIAAIGIRPYHGSEHQWNVCTGGVDGSGRVGVSDDAHEKQFHESMLMVLRLLWLLRRSSSGGGDNVVRIWEGIGEDGGWVRLGLASSWVQLFRQVVGSGWSAGGCSDEGFPPVVVITFFCLLIPLFF